jgi:hypothetical protein
VSQLASGGRRAARSKRRLIMGAVAALALGSVFVAAQVASAGKQQTPTTLSPLSAGVQVAQALRAGTLSAAPAGAQSVESPDLSVLPNVKANAGSQPSNEVPITADPSNGTHLLSGSNDYNCGTVQGFYSSSNSGSSWTSHCMTALAGFSGDGDPDVAYDTSGNSYIAGIQESGGVGRIVYEKSTNNGSTWSATATAVLPLFASGFTDKDWMESDHGTASPRPGALYISVTQFNSGFTQDAISVAHSYDGGATWSDVQVDPTQNLSSQVDQFSDLAVANDGTVYVTWMRCPPTGPTGDCGGTTAKMLISKSTNGGVTWSAATQITTATLAPDSCGAYYGCVPGTNERVSNLPVVDVDHSTGAVYVAYYNYNGTTMQVKVRKSTDGGATWGAAKGIFGSANTHQQWLHWLSVGPTGQVGVTMNYTKTGTQYMAKAAFSTDGGATYTKRKTSTVLSNTTSDGFGGGFIGDYTGNIWVGGTLHQSWPDTRTGVSADETGGLVTP